MSKTAFEVEVVFATPELQCGERAVVADGATVADAITASGILKQFPEIDLERNPVGIFSRRCELSTKVSPDDRVEIYRPLPQDPNSRRQVQCQ